MIVDYACGHMMYIKQKKEGDQHVDCLLQNSTLMCWFNDLLLLITIYELKWENLLESPCLELDTLSL